jgi:hypothetical protein
LRKGHHGAKDVAVVRPFAINLVGHANDIRAIKTRRNRAARDPRPLRAILEKSAR